MQKKIYTVPAYVCMVTIALRVHVNLHAVQQVKEDVCSLPFKVICNPLAIIQFISRRVWFSGFACTKSSRSGDCQAA